MKSLRILGTLFRQTGADKILLIFAAFIAFSSILIWLLDPAVDSPGDSLWYCYAVATTTGFGDVVPDTFLARTISVILSIYAAVVIAIFTGIIVNFYNQLSSVRNRETITAFMDKLETLPDMSKEELKELSEKVRRFRSTGKI